MNYVYIVLIIALLICLVVLLKKMVNIVSKSQNIKNGIAKIQNKIEETNIKKEKLSKTKENIKFFVTIYAVASLAKELLVEHKVKNKKKAIKTTANLAYKTLKKSV